MATQDDAEMNAAGGPDGDHQGKLTGMALE